MTYGKRQFIGVLVFVVVLVVIILAIGNRGGWNNFLSAPEPKDVAVSVTASRVDPDNEGRLVSVQGQLLAEKPPEDSEFGLIAKDSVLLVRDVEMYQWLEDCIDGNCTQRTAWSGTWIDSTAFNEQTANENPDKFPVESARFAGEGIHIGVFEPDIKLLESTIGLKPRPIQSGELSANLAASFGVSGNELLSGSDPLHPEIGDLRIRYSDLPSAPATVIGIQEGTHLLEAPTSQVP